MAEPALNDVQRHGLSSELERVRMAQLMRREREAGALPQGAAELAADRGA